MMMKTQRRYAAEYRNRLAELVRGWQNAAVVVSAA